MAGVIETVFNEKADTLVFTVAGVGEIRMPLNVLNTDIQKQAMVHGLRQKVADAAALSRNPETGKPATPEDKFRAMQRVAERLMGMDGGPAEWNARPGAGEGQPGSLLVQALVRITGRPVAEIDAEVGKMDKKTQAALRADPDVAPVVAQIKADQDAKAGRGVDTKGLLGKLRAGDPA